VTVFHVRDYILDSSALRLCFAMTLAWSMKTQSNTGFLFSREPCISSFVHARSFRFFTMFRDFPRTKADLFFSLTMVFDSPPRLRESPGLFEPAILLSSPDGAGHLRKQSPTRPTAVTRTCVGSPFFTRQIQGLVGGSVPKPCPPQRGEFSPSGACQVSI